MVNALDRKLLDYIIKKCGNDKTCLLDGADDVFTGRKTKRFYDMTSSLLSLSEEGYVDFVPASKGEETVYCVSLKPRSKLIARERAEEKKTYLFKIVFAVFSAIATFLIGRLLYLIFK